MKRHINLTDIKPTGYCLWCNIKVTGKKRKYCSEKCRKDYYEHNYSHAFRDRIIRERKVCQKCGKLGYFEVHHIIPISQGGKLFDDDNVLLLCKKCHKKIHKRRELLEEE